MSYRIEIEEKDCTDYYCPLNNNSLCRGSQCMAWRWTKEFYTFRDSSTTCSVSHKQSETRGFCGMADGPR